MIDSIATILEHSNTDLLTLLANYNSVLAQFEASQIDLEVDLAKNKKAEYKNQGFEIISPDANYPVKTYMHSSKLIPGGKYFHFGPLIISGNIPDNVIIENDHGPIIITGFVGKNCSFTANGSCDLQHLEWQQLTSTHIADYVLEGLPKQQAKGVNDGVCLVDCYKVGEGTIFNTQNLTLIDSKISLSKEAVNNAKITCRNNSEAKVDIQSDIGFNTTGAKLISRHLSSVTKVKIVDNNGKEIDLDKADETSAFMRMLQKNRSGNNNQAEIYENNNYRS